MAALIRRDRDSLHFRWRQQVRELPSAQHLDAPTLNDHLPKLIDELAAALEARSDIVKAFVEAHDGKVRVESKEGLGSTFRFTLPPKQSTAAPDA